MDPLQFAYWLQGFSELNEAPPTVEQWQSIKEHLGLVFTKITQPVFPQPGIVPNISPSIGPNALPMPWRTECRSGYATSTC